jgi:haloalkane dehalogenase
MNTFAHRWREPVDFPLPVRLFRARRIGELLVKRLDLFRKFTMFIGPTAINPDRMTDAVRAAYTAPHPEPNDRAAILQFVRNIPAGPDDPGAEFMGEIEDRLAAGFRDEQVTVCRGLKDPVFTEHEFLERLWLHTFPDARVIRIPDASHFVQEDAPDVAVPALLDLIQQTSARHAAGAIAGEAVRETVGSR